MAKGERKAIYDTVIGDIFSRLFDLSPTATYHEFTKDLLENTVRELRAKNKIPKIVKNIPDIKYTYDAREEFPELIRKQGYWAIIGRGKSRYRFVRLARNNLIRIPSALPVNPPPRQVEDKTPKLVGRMLGDDEQAMLARLAYSNVISLFTNLRTMRVQGHERTTVSSGQIEVDEVYAGQDSIGKEYVIPISAKGGGKDMLSYTQALNLNSYAAEKAKYKGLGVRPLGITRGADDSVYLLEFTAALDITKIKIERVERFLLSPSG